VFHAAGQADQAGQAALDGRRGGERRTAQRGSRFDTLACRDARHDAA
jgi:hypothetical protein